MCAALGGGNARRSRFCVDTAGSPLPRTVRIGFALGAIPGWRILDPSFWFALLRLQASTQRSNGPGALYEVLLPYLASDDPAAAQVGVLSVGALLGH